MPFAEKENLYKSARHSWPRDTLLREALVWLAVTIQAPTLLLSTSLSPLSAPLRTASRPPHLAEPSLPGPAWQLLFCRVFP